MTDTSLLQTQTQQAFWAQQGACVQTVQHLLTTSSTPEVRAQLQQLIDHQSRVQALHYAFLNQLPDEPTLLPDVAIPQAPAPAVHQPTVSPTLSRSEATNAPPPPPDPRIPPPPSPAPTPSFRARQITQPPAPPVPPDAAAEPPAPPPRAAVSPPEPLQPAHSGLRPSASSESKAPPRSDESVAWQAPSIEQRTIRPRHRVEFWLFQKLKRWAEQSSPRARFWVEKALEALLWHSQARRKVVDRNLELAFPEWSPQERHQLARKNYQWFVRFSLDVLEMGAWQGRANEFVDFVNLEVLDQALAEQRGVLMVGGHFGNWEYLCPALSERGYATTMYVGRQTNPLSDRLQNEERLRSGIQTIGKGRTATTELIEALRHNRAVGMLIDQDERSSGVFVDFFGIPASSSRGAAAFHLLQKSPVILFTCCYVGARIRITFERIPFQPSGRNEQDVPDLTARIQHALEQQIREHPEQYFWMHRRWRTRPPEEPGLYENS